MDQTVRTLNRHKEKMPCEASWMHPAHSLKMMDCGDFGERVATAQFFVWWQGQGNSCQVGPESQSHTTSKHIWVLTKSLSSGLTNRYGFRTHAYIWTEWITWKYFYPSYSRGISLLLFLFHSFIHLLIHFFHLFTVERNWIQPLNPPASVFLEAGLIFCTLMLIPDTLYLWLHAPSP